MVRLSIMNKQKEEIALRSLLHQRPGHLSLPGTQKVDPAPARADAHDKEEPSPEPTRKVTVVLQWQEAQVSEPEIKDPQHQQEATEKHFQRDHTTLLHGM
jgi:hypothetical protein